MGGQLMEIILYREGETWAQTGRGVDRARITILIANVTLCQALFQALSNFILTKTL